MKIRNGFVSNSSSSSFICDVCGIVESGMDASASDFDMNTCANGHTFCNSHCENIPELTPDRIRKYITEQINNESWSNAERKREKLEYLGNTTDDELEDLLNEEYSDDGVHPDQCPICSLSILSDVDGFAYLKRKLKMNNNDVLKEIKTTFKDYDDFDDYLRPKNGN